jgi:hypothetical protein
VYCISTKPRLEVEEYEPFSERGELKGMLEYPLIYIITYIYILYTPIYIKSPKPHHVKTLLTAGDESEVAHCFPLPAVMDMFAITD